jgi:hypothetical protein
LLVACQGGKATRTPDAAPPAAAAAAPDAAPARADLTLHAARLDLAAVAADVRPAAAGHARGKLAAACARYGQAATPVFADLQTAWDALGQTIADGGADALARYGLAATAAADRLRPSRPPEPAIAELHDRLVDDLAKLGAAFGAAADAVRKLDDGALDAAIDDIGQRAAALRATVDRLRALCSS